MFCSFLVSRISKSKYGSLKGLRGALAEKIMKLDKFGRLSAQKQDVKSINSKIEKQYYKAIKARLFVD